MRLLLGLLAFGIWSFGSGYWYVCKIKGHCWGDDLRPVEIVNEGIDSRLLHPAPPELGSSDFVELDQGDLADTEVVSETDDVDLEADLEAEGMSPEELAELPLDLQAPHAILFGYAKPIISANGDTEAYIKSLAGYLTSHPQAKVRIAGYTDDTAAKWKNKELSMKRAEAIAVMLEAEGISRDKMELEAMGEANPIATNETPAGRKRNRRAEITVLNP